MGEPEVAVREAGGEAKIDVARIGRDVVGGAGGDELRPIRRGGFVNEVPVDRVSFRPRPRRRLPDRDFRS
jgi:hypothetical protein